MTHRFSFRKALALGTLAAALAAAGSTSGAVPPSITQQGRLLDADGDPVTGEITFVFTIYDDPSASDATNQLWAETQAITLDEGYFSTRLGDDSSNPLPANLFDGSMRYLGVKVGSDDEMTPRQDIASVPYALLANNALSADTALTADSATTATTATTAQNVTGDITPASVTVNGVEVIDSAGMVPAAAIKGFSSLLTVATTSFEGNTGTVECGEGRYALGGGCGVIGTDPANSPVLVKQNEPSVSGGKPVGWACWCMGTEDTSVECTVEVSAVCLQEN